MYWSTSRLLTVLTLWLYLIYYVYRPEHISYTGITAIAIVADEEQLHTLGKAAASTWALSNNMFDVYFFVGKETQLQHSMQNVVKLNASNEYPPIKKIFEMWKYLYQRYENKYDWFMKVDADSYVNTELLIKTLNILRRQNHLNHYIGYPGTRIRQKIKTLGIEKPYCLGMGYIIGRNTLKSFGMHIDKCEKHAVTNHSDTEIGRCIKRFCKNTYCTDPPVLFKQLYYQVSNGVVSNGKRDDKNRILLDFPSRPPTSMFYATLVHPIKNAEKMILFHEQLTKNLRPIIDRIVGCNDNVHPKLCKIAMQESEKSCVNNPIRQLENTINFTLPECKFRFYNSKIIPSLEKTSTFVVNVTKDFYSASRVQEALIKDHKIIASVFEISSLGFEETMKSLIHFGIEHNIERMFVVNDNIILHCDFGILMRKLISDDRCGRYMFCEHSNGVLLLGASIQDRTFMDEDLANNNGTLCFNAYSKILDSSAIMMHESVYIPMLEWIYKHENNESYYQVFKYLADIGHIVRIAYPSLIHSNIGFVNETCFT